ncbi:hypothetical protein Tco_1212071 [Tanacetum coccineum]
MFQTPLPSLIAVAVVLSFDNLIKAKELNSATVSCCVIQFSDTRIRKDIAITAYDDLSDSPSLDVQEDVNICFTLIE